MKLSEITNVEVWTSTEEQHLLDKLPTKMLLSSLTPREQVIAQSLIRKGLLKKIGHYDPKILKN